MASKYAKRHYEDIAALMAREITYRPERPNRKTTLRGVVRELVDLFARDNPRFDRERFIAACGLVDA